MIALKCLIPALLVCSLAAPGPAAGPAIVQMTPEMTFMPKELSVMVGEVVVWKNEAKEPHSVNTVPENCRTEDGKKWIKIPAGATAFFSGEIKPGDEYRVRFEVPGTYQYLCTFHEHATMRGIIIVTAAEVR